MLTQQKLRITGELTAKFHLIEDVPDRRASHSPASALQHDFHGWKRCETGGIGKVYTHDGMSHLDHMLRPDSLTSRGVD